MQMPVGINQWRAGIAGRRSLVMSKIPKGLEIPVVGISLCALQYFVYMYLFICSSILALPLSLVVCFFWTHLAAIVVPATTPKSTDVSRIFAKIYSHVIVYLWLAFSLFIKLPKLCKNILFLQQGVPTESSVFSTAYSFYSSCWDPTIDFSGWWVQPIQPAAFMWRYSSKSWPRN